MTRRVSDENARTLTRLSDHPTSALLRDLALDLLDERELSEKRRAWIESRQWGLGKCLECLGVDPTVYDDTPGTETRFLEWPRGHTDACSVPTLVTE